MISGKWAEKLNSVLESRGYIVLASHAIREVGSIIGTIDTGGDWVERARFEHPFRVIAHTDQADWEEQARVVGAVLYSEGREGRRFFCRVITD